MKRIGDVDVLKRLSIRINTSGASMHPSSVGEDECPKCGGAGYVRVDVPVGHPNFGRLFPCECKVQERERRRIDEFTEMSGLAMFDAWTFDSFDPAVPGVRDAYEACFRYAQNPDGWLFLLGTYGCGKTHLAAAVANHVMTHQRMFPLFTVVPDLLDHLRAAFAPDQTTSYDERFYQIRNAGLLILDDLGTENTTAWATEKLFQIINFRYNQRKATIITSNRDIDKLDPRIASRLKDNGICQHLYLNAGDYRERRSRFRRS